MSTPSMLGHPRRHRHPNDVVRVPLLTSVPQTMSSRARALTSHPQRVGSSPNTRYPPPSYLSEHNHSCSHALPLSDINDNDNNNVPRPRPRPCHLSLPDDNITHPHPLTTTTTTTTTSCALTLSLTTMTTTTTMTMTTSCTLALSLMTMTTTCPRPHYLSPPDNNVTRPHPPTLRHATRTQRGRCTRGITLTLTLSSMMTTRDQ